jgi:hypothetical protein
MLFVNAADGEASLPLANELLWLCSRAARSERPPSKGARDAARRDRPPSKGARDTARSDPPIETLARR